LIANLILVFLSDVVCAEALVSDGVAVCGKLGKAGQEPNFSSGKTEPQRRSQGSDAQRAECHTEVNSLLDFRSFAG
jgi:hypothetical protein